MSWKKYFKPVNSVLPVQQTGGGSSFGASAVSKFSTWLPEVYQGPPNRLQRYIQYEQMDLDHEINAALDTIAEFSTQKSNKNETPFEIKYRTEDVSGTEIELIEKVLKQWVELNQLNNRMFRIFRSVLMYGDQFFIRDPETYKLIWVDPSTVEKVVVNESKGKDIEAYYIKDLDLNLQTLTGSNTIIKTELGYNSSNSLFPQAPITGQPGGYSSSSTPHLYNQQGSYTGGGSSFPVDAAHVVHVSLTEGMDNSWPFGTSVLESIFKIYKQKELLEDSILIYRVHRAPERRVFFIDVGNMPPNKAQQYLERVRYEVQQKRIPSRTGGGQSVVDSSYNPMSMLEDYFFAQTSDGRGSKVETLPGGENLGQIDDLRYFNNKMIRALGVPSSYLPTGPEDGSNAYNDGRVGTAFIQEFRFNQKCKRYQSQIIEKFDLEFKLFLKNRGITIDSSTFELEFSEPQSFSDYRRIEIDTARTNVFNAVIQTPFISKRYALKKYLGWSEDEVRENEKLWKEENSIEEEEGVTDADLRSVGINPPGGDAPLGGMEGDEEMDTESEDMGSDLDADITDDDIDNFGEE